jgi:hypothetical protein
VLRRQYGRIDWDEAVDFAFASIELDERTCGIVVSVLEELVERRRDLAVDTGRVTDEPEPQVAPAWDRRLIETERVLYIAGQALGAKPIRASSIVDQAHHSTPVQ